jgi:conjugative transfer signal peptidase TraF
MARSTLLFVLAVLVVLACLPWFRVNVSPSAPLGLYRLRAVTLPLERGRLVVMPVPSSVRRWQSAWVPIMKPVAGMAGDVVCSLGHILFVNGVSYGPVYAEAEGMPLPQPIEGLCQFVREGYVVVASPAPRSLDSRYFGEVPIRALTAQATPLLTWEDGWTHRRIN